MDQGHKSNPGKDHFWIDGNFFVYVSTGTAQNVHLPNTDVSLDIPEGSCGYFLMRVRTDDAIYINSVLPKDECYVAALIEVEHVPFDGSELNTEDDTFTLTVAHCLEEQGSKKFLKVRQFSGVNGKRELKPSDSPNLEEGCFWVDGKFIRMCISKFSIFICTYCKNICKTRERAYICGQLDSYEENSLTTVKIKCYLCGILFSLEEFRQV